MVYGDQSDVTCSLDSNGQSSLVLSTVTGNSSRKKYSLTSKKLTADIKNGKATFSEHALIDGED